jgi:hypothetical protein
MMMMMMMMMHEMMAHGPSGDRLQHGPRSHQLAGTSMRKPMSSCQSGPCPTPFGSGMHPHAWRDVPPLSSAERPSVPSPLIHETPPPRASSSAQCARRAPQRPDSGYKHRNRRPKHEHAMPPVPTASSSRIVLKKSLGGACPQAHPVDERPME